VSIAELFRANNVAGQYRAPRIKCGFPEGL
jgi:hypothetical protein